MTDREWGDGSRWVILHGFGGWSVMPPDRIYSGRHSSYDTFDEARRAFIDQTNRTGVAP